MIEEGCAEWIDQETREQNALVKGGFIMIISLY